MNYFKLHYPLIASLLFITIIVIGHIIATNNYNWTQHTISHLGSQEYKNKWVMQFGFLIFGLIVVTGITLNSISLRTIPFLIYGLCIALTGIFCTAPFFKVSNYNIQHANLHSLFAQIAGITFSIGILIQIFYTSDNLFKKNHLVCFILVIGTSALFGLLNHHQGIVQRLLYLISLYWFSFWFQTHD